MCGSYFDSDLQCLKKNNANIRSKLLKKNPEIDTAPTDKKKKKNILFLTRISVRNGEIILQRSLTHFRDELCGTVKNFLATGRDIFMEKWSLKNVTLAKESVTDHARLLTLQQ